MISDDEIKAALMFKLHKRGNWGASHTALDNLKKGWKESELGRRGLKRVEQMARELMRQGAIIPKPTSYGTQVSLNPRQAEAIMELMRRFFSDI